MVRFSIVLPRVPQAATYDILERSSQILGNGTVGQQYDQHMDPIKSYTTPNWQVVEVSAVRQYSLSSAAAAAHGPTCNCAAVALLGL